MEKLLLPGSQAAWPSLMVGTSPPGIARPLCTCDPSVTGCMMCVLRVRAGLAGAWRYLGECQGTISLMARHWMLCEIHWNWGTLEVSYLLYSPRICSCTSPSVSVIFGNNYMLMWINRWMRYLQMSIDVRIKVQQAVACRVSDTWAGNRWRQQCVNAWSKWRQQHMSFDSFISSQAFFNCLSTFRYSSQCHDYEISGDVLLNSH